jgi:signal transduction histidine kinase/CheY-like chemotaxis protein
MRVLLVDDLPVNLKLLRVVFQSEGHLTFEAADGVEALEKLAVHPVDVVISDILMPNMDGYRLCRTIRQNPELDRVAVVIYTSTYISPGDKELALECGADAYLTKPAAAREVIQTALTAVAQRERGKVNASVPMEEVFLRQYNQALVQKLEERNVTLEERTRLLGESERKFRTLVENLQAVFFLTGPGWRPMQYVSPSYEVLWGKSCQSLYEYPDSWRNSIVPEDLPVVTQTLRESPTSFVLEFRIATAEGLRWIRMRAVPSFGDRGEVSGVCGLAEDQTPLKLAELQFQQAQKMDGIGRLAGGVAHDFNNILTAIYGFNSLTSLKIGADHPAYKNIQMVEKLVGRAAKLTHQLLSFSRKQIIQPRVVDLLEVVDNLEKMVAPLLGEDIELTVRRGGGPHTVRVDPGQIEQVMFNLCVNARDAMPTGGELEITVERRLRDSTPGRAWTDWVVLMVRDSGTGIDQGTMKHLFEPFFTTKEVGKGTGLGLATCYGIVSQSGGKIEVSSEPGQGALFTIFLPAVAPVDQVPVVAESRGDSQPDVGTILVVDDDPDVAAATVQSLTDQGFLVLFAGGPEEALALVGKDRDWAIQLVITDVVMPHLSGKELAAEILKVRPGMRILFASGYMDESIVVRGIEAQDFNLIRKPFTPRELVDKVREVFGAGTSNPHRS